MPKHKAAIKVHEQGVMSKGLRRQPEGVPIGQRWGNLRIKNNNISSGLKQIDYVKIQVTRIVKKFNDHFW